jgi:hypothetical protein
MDYKNIIQGFINAGRAYVKYPSKEIEKKALARFEVCLKCPLISEDKYRCTKCGCVLSAKTRSNSKCPENKWI